MSAFDLIYSLSPIWLQNQMVTTFGIYWHWLRFGGRFRSYLQEFKERDRWTFSQWEQFQNSRLHELLQICSHSVPFYREMWSQKEKNSADSGDLFSLPLLEKNSIREDPYAFCREDFYPSPKLVFHTSGTTGTPIKSIWTVSEQRKSLALREARSANWAGVSFSQSRATFSGRIVEPDPDEEEHVYRYNAAEKQVYFSAFHLKPSTAHRYVEALQKHKVVWMTGYAVSFFLLARFILDQGLKLPPLKAIITTSEKLTPEMRSVMEKAYHCKVYEEYSTVESALFASECEHGRLHVSPDVGIVEILRPDGTPCEPGEVGEVVATCLFRSYQPLIRFRLGDLAAWDPELCPCGRQMPVIKEVVGRIEDVVTGPDGRQLVRFHGIFTDQPNIIEGQIIQLSLHDVLVKIVPTPNFSEKDVLSIKSRLLKLIGAEVNIIVEPVQSIPRSSSGKFQSVKSKIINS
jgi:phenylacetate-CoA ligase